jgi:hypothetical protein
MKISKEHCCSGLDKDFAKHPYYGYLYVTKLYETT